MIRKLAVLFAVLVCWTGPGTGASAQELVDTSRWEAYLDYAYVYVSADTATLRERLDQYGQEAQMTLAEYIAIEGGEAGDQGLVDDEKTRRLAVAHLLDYLSTREPQSLARAVDLISEFRDQNGRHENLYWHHYIMAHRALDKGAASDFTREILALWMDVVVPLESPYETLQALSLSQSANSGFVSALPYVFENVTRMILLRSQEMGVHRDLDPLAAVVRMLGAGRVGAHPEVIPPDASSKAYLDRIIARLDGAASDGGSLTFTLMLFEAGKYHDQARGLLASEGLSEETIKAMGVATGAYQTALGLAETLQGEGAVYARVLRQLGEVWAAKQRLGVDPYVEMPLTIEGAIAVYRDLHAAGIEDDWKREGYRRTGFESYVASMQGLWEEIQEASLNAADYYLTRSIAEPTRADEHIRSAARTYGVYLAFFEAFATEEGAPFVPDSAHFAAYEAAKGFGDSFLHYSASTPSAAEIQKAVERYLFALRLYPFDRNLWPALAGALERQGRSNQFLALARPIADATVRSRHLDAWIEDGEEGAEEVAILRRAMSDELAIMYLGFADAEGLDELETSLAELKGRRDAVEARLAQLRSGGVAMQPGPAAQAPSSDGAAASESSVIERAKMQREVEQSEQLLARLDKQLASRNRALPLFQATLTTDELIRDLRGRRDHPLHTLLRRLHHETRPGGASDDE